MGMNVSPYHCCMYIVQKVNMHNIPAIVKIQETRGEGGETSKVHLSKGCTWLL